MSGAPGRSDRWDRRWVIAAWVVVAACVAAALAPLFAARDLPMPDLPNNLGAVAIWHHFDDPRYGFSEYYQLQLRFVPYSAYYGTVHALSWLMPIRIAHKVFLAFTVLGLPAGLWAYLRAHRRPQILALAGFPLAWSYLIMWGFIAYSAGAALLLYSLSLLRRLADARPWAGYRIILANIAVGFGLYLLHPLPWLLWVPLVCIYVPRRALQLISPSALLFAYQLLRPAAAGLNKGKMGEVLAGKWAGVGQSLKGFRNVMFEYLPISWPHRLFLVYLLALALALIFVQRDRVRTQDRRPVAVFFFLFFAYFLLPIELNAPITWGLINTRLPILVTLASFGLVAGGELRGWRGAIVAVPLVAMSIAYPLNVAKRYAEFDKRAGDFYVVIEQLPYNPSVLTLIYERDDPVTILAGHGWDWRHWDSMVQIERGGFNPNAWDNGFPFGTKKGLVAKPAPAGGSAADFKWDKYAQHYDYFLTRGDEAKRVFGPRKDVVLLAERGKWRLWQKIDQVR